MSRTYHSLPGYLRIIVGAWREDARSDAELLTRFAESGDEVAFESLVCRHGKLVWQTCRHILGNTPDAEDAFQATLMILARKAGRLRRGPLAGWLHRVARRAALDVNTSLRRRRNFERQHPDVLAYSEAVGGIANDKAELCAVIDEELANLPERLKVPLILHYLEGKSQVEAARILGCARSVLQKRLAKGETLLHKKLQCRGLAPGVASIAVLSRNIIEASAVPVCLIGTTLQAAIAFRAGTLTSRAAETAEKLLHSLSVKGGLWKNWWLVLAGICSLSSFGTSFVAWKMSRDRFNAADKLTASVAATVQPTVESSKQQKEKVPMPASDKPLRVLLFASAPTRDYQFLRAFLNREVEKKQIELAIYLQIPLGSERRASIVQDVPPERNLQRFPEVLKEPDKKSTPSTKWDNLLSYDTIIAFDPNWEQVPKKSREHLERWVRLHKGSLVTIAGPLNTSKLASAPPDGELKPIIDLYPVKLDVRNLDEVLEIAQPLRFFPAIRESYRKLNAQEKQKISETSALAIPQRVSTLLTDLDNDDYKVRIRTQNKLRKMGKDAKPFLVRALNHKSLSAEVRQSVEKLLSEMQEEDVKLEDARFLDFLKSKWPEFFDDWSEFFFDYYRVDWQATRDRPKRGFSCYPDTGIKPGATVVAVCSSGESFLVTMPYGFGKVVYLGSGETWRLRQYKESLYERLWRNILSCIFGAN